MCGLLYVCAPTSPRIAGLGRQQRAGRTLAGIIRVPAPTGGRQRCARSGCVHARESVCLCAHRFVRCECSGALRRETDKALSESPSATMSMHSAARTVIAYERFPLCCCLLPAACCLLPAACCLLPAACCLLPAACCCVYRNAFFVCGTKICARQATASALLAAPAPLGRTWTRKQRRKPLLQRPKALVVTRTKASSVRSAAPCSRSPPPPHKS